MSSGLLVVFVVSGSDERRLDFVVRLTSFQYAGSVSECVQDERLCFHASTLHFNALYLERKVKCRNSSPHTFAIRFYSFKLFAWVCLTKRLGVSSSFDSHLVGTDAYPAFARRDQNAIS